jgi:hypothetical protein
MTRNDEANPKAVVARPALIERLSLGYRSPKHRHLAEALAAVFDEDAARMREVLAADTPLSWLLNRQRLGPIEGAEVWESFVARGLVSIDWLEDERRLFGPGRNPPHAHRWNGAEDARGRDPSNARSFPYEYVDAITFGANREAIVEAETLVRDALTLRWSPGEPPPSTVLWRALPRAFAIEAARTSALATLAAALDEPTIRAVNARGVALGGIESRVIFLSLAPAH